MRFPPHLLDEIRARLPVSHVVGRKVVLKKKGRELWGLSPFKSEKTPSFSVNDTKGFYHCFATQEHGDIFTFLIKTEGVSFPEAVERLAAQAGVSLPKQKSTNPEQENERARLSALIAQSAEFFAQQLFTSAGRAARDYLVDRQIDDETIKTFALGYAPDNRQALKVFLSEAGFSESDMIRSGMLIGGKDIPKSYDRFRHRLIFPIHDLKGNVIAFGGRALRVNEPAKYLNSPETPLFHKGRVLYNSHRARESAFRTGEVIAVEGYMDAIALAQSGHMQTVAPLGTALTREQLQMLWRMTPEPIMCFDGDDAGRKAAYRALDTALPVLKAGFSLRFVFLSNGLDPDDLIRQQGAEAIRVMLDQAQPLADVIWEREWNAGEWSTPERRAALEARLRSLIEQIADPSVKSHYAMALRQRLRNVWQSSVSPVARTKAMSSKGVKNLKGSLRNLNKEANWGRNTLFQSERASSNLKSTPLVAGEGHNIYREASLIRALLNHPWLLSEFSEAIAELDFSSPVLQRLRDNLLFLLNDELELDTTTIRYHLAKIGSQKDIELVDRSTTHKNDRFAEPDTSAEDVEKGWHYALSLHKLRTLRSQLNKAEQEYCATNNDDVATKILELQLLISALHVAGAQPDD